jgi:UDP-galactose transporter B1
MFLVFFQCFFNGLLALIISLVKTQPPDTVPWSDYSKISVSYIGAMYASNWALAFVSYPTQALAKSCKMIPVMLMRIVINGKRYTLREYMTVALITVGISTFMLFKAGGKSGGETSLFGLFLLFTSLALDGFTGPTQENIIAAHKPSTTQLMFYMNLISTGIMFVALVATGQLMPSIAFLTKYPAVLKQLAIFSVCSAAGQNFILYTVVRFNSLVLTTITTTRKFFTILVSVFWFGHNLVAAQWGGVSLVFLGLGIDMYFKAKASKAKKALESKAA